MAKDHPGEKWKLIKFGIDSTNIFRMEVSNLGRVRSFNQISDGNILKGSTINGYRIIRLKFFIHREAKKQKEFDNWKLQILKAARQLRSAIENKENKKIIAGLSSRLDELKKTFSAKIKIDEKSRTIHYHSLIHRLVASYFLPKPTKGKLVVAHLDYNKLNNKVNNLKWMTLEENYEHQKKSPHVIAQKKLRANNLSPNSTTKLSVAKVMQLKKLLKQETKTIRQLAKQFKVTDTQIIRIKKGENWGTVKAAT
ncbi:MAG: HNH endonuclease [Ferruginibacter sp.]